MKLETMRPNPTWDPAGYEDAIETFATHRASITVRIWGGDWCTDCRQLLPDFAAALEAAEVPDDRIEVVPVDRDFDGKGVDEYDIERIPTIVVVNERGDEMIRFVERERRPPVVWLAEAIDERR